MRGQDYYYSKIVDELNLKIGLENILSECIFHMKNSWPASMVSLYGQLEKHCQNSNKEVSVKTLNGKGTIVIKPDDTKLHQLALNSGYVEKSLRYLHALQLMVLIIRPAALVAAPQFTKVELDELANRFTSPGSIYLTDILNL